LNRAALTSLVNSGGSSLMTTWRCSDASVARNRRLMPPAAQLLLDPVGVAERGLEASQQVTHGR